MNVGKWEVIFGFLLAGVSFDGPWGSIRDLVLSEEDDHEGLFGAWTSATHQPDPARRQGAVWKNKDRFRDSNPGRHIKDDYTSVCV